MTKKERQKILEFIENLEAKQYEAETILIAFKNNIRFNKFK